MATTDDGILNELQDISHTLDGLASDIRDGRYDPPKGTDPIRPRATPDDIFNRLGTIIGLLERQNEILFNMGYNAADDKADWRVQNG